MMRRHLMVLLGLLVGLSMVAAACGSDDDDAGGSGASDGADRPAIVVGAQDFGESKVLAEIYAQAFEAEGWDASVQELAGYRDILLGAFESGDVNFSAEYAASLLEYLNGDDKTEATGDVEETVGFLDGYLADNDLVALAAAPGVDTNAFVITRETADELGIESLSDLADKGGDLVLGAPSDCETNAFCLPGLESTYGLDLSANFVSIDDGPSRVSALEAGEIDIAVVFSSDSTIVAKDLVLLEDDQNLLAADNVLPVVSTEIDEAYGSELRDLADKISAKLTTEVLLDLNDQFDNDKRDAADIAKDWLEEEGLVS